MVRISEIQQFPGRNFWKLLKEISATFAAVSKFLKVLFKWKVPAHSQSKSKFPGRKKEHYGLCGNSEQH